MIKRLRTIVPALIAMFTVALSGYATVGLRTSAIAGRISTGCIASQRLPVVNKFLPGREWLLPFLYSVKSKSLPAYRLAYVDPGSGQLVWQMLLAGCVGTLFYVKRVRAFLAKQVAKWFKNKD